MDQILVRCTGPAATLPEYQTPGAAGADVRAHLEEPAVLRPGERRLIPTGLSLQIPEGYEAQVRPRSGLALRHGITMVNAPGTIDSDYRGEVGVLLINLGHEEFVVEPGARVGQLIFAPVSRARFERESTLEDSDRGQGGFGSTGR
jgi:dUTP pyrophosphatase